VRVHVHYSNQKTLFCFFLPKDQPFRVYIGYDSHEDITFEVAKFSMLKNASVPIDVIPLKRAELQAKKCCSQVVT